MENIDIISYFENVNFDFISTIIIGIVSGIISGVIANMIFRYNSFKNKPKIFLCENIIKQFMENDEPILRIKIVNQGINSISDIKIILYGVNYLDTEKKLKDLNKISQSFIEFLDSKDKSSNGVTDYIFQLALKNKSNNIHNMLEDYDTLLLLVRGTDTYYSSTISDYKEFKKENIKDYTWNFNTGDDYSCTKNNRIKEPNHEQVTKWFVKPELPTFCPLLEKNT